RDDIEEEGGRENVLKYNKLIDKKIPESFISASVKEKFEKDGNKQILVNSEYKAATEEENAQIEEIKKIVKSYDSNGMITGEGALTKDLTEIADRDIDRVSTISYAAVCVLIVGIYYSISIPFF